MATRSVTADDARVLHAAAQHGRAYLRLPDDAEWLTSVAGEPDPSRRLAGMQRRGSLLPVGRGRYVVLPLGASTLEQAGPPKLLLAALLDGRASWYLGYLSALIDHKLTDEHSQTLFVAIAGRSPLGTKRSLGTQEVRFIQDTTGRAWEGVERERIQGRTFGYRSGIECTLLDVLEQPRACGTPETWVRAWGRASREALVDLELLVHYGQQRNETVQARLAYWLRETGHVRHSRLVAKLLGGPLSGSRLLDASQTYGAAVGAEGRRVERDRETGLMINLPQHLSDGWLAYGK